MNTTESPSRFQRPALAFLMSLTLPGFGQLYNGQLNKAIGLFLGFALLCGPGVALVALYLPPGATMPALLLGLLGLLAIWLYSMADAWRSARLRGAAEPGWRERGGVYLLVWLLGALLVLPLLIHAVRQHQVASFYIPQRSMEPTVLQGDVLFADMRYNCPGCRTAVERGDIAIFVYPNNRIQHYIKRVIALPGDRVKVQGHTVWVNERPLALETAAIQPSSATQPGLVTEAWDKHQWQVQWDASADADTGSGISLTVPPGEVFVLGDNRHNSKDSREFGTVPLRDIVGKARQLWFSKAPGGGVRWQRLGLTLDTPSSLPAP